MLEKLELKDFKNHVHTEVDFGRLTLLVGANGSGKTSILEGLLLLCRGGTGPALDLSTVTGSPQDLIRNEQGSTTAKISGVSQSEKFKIVVTFSAKEEPSRDFSCGTLHHTAISGGGLPGGLQRLSGMLRPTVHLKLSPRRLSAPSYSEDIPPQVGSYGEGLASTLAYLMTNEPERFQALMSLIKKVLPFVKTIRVRPAKVRLSKEKVLSVDDKTLPIDTSLDVTGHEMLLDTEGTRGIPSHVVSDGTLLTIGLLTILASPNCPNLILLDDVEQGLHPRAQRELVGVLQQLLEERPELQIVLTTHSPYVVDEVDASDVWVLAANAAGRTRARRLTEVPDAKKALEVLTAGELWAAEGEDWVHEAAGGND